nr:MAG TPA: hypothetical protein [Caudoviricetes sp.]
MWRAMLIRNTVRKKQLRASRFFVAFDWGC